MLTKLFSVRVLGSLLGLIYELQQQRLSVFVVMFAIGFGVVFVLTVLFVKSDEGNTEQERNDKS
jgi:lipid-A-disaccharide synthase-like uncharacterized protein